MTKIDFRPATLAILALGAGLAASPAFAQDRFLVPAETRVVSAQPVVEVEPALVPPNVFGQYSCAFNELHSRLERKACGGTHDRYGY